MKQYKLSPDISRVLKYRSSLKFQDIDLQSVQSIRDFNERTFRHSFAFKRLYRPVKNGISRASYIIPVENGDSVSGVLFKREKSRLSDPASLIIYLHDGGWIKGNMEIACAICSNICNVTGSAVLALDYRLAPDFKFPVPVHDCHDAFLWAYQGAKYWKLDPSKIFFMGCGSGANLAIAASRLARDRNEAKPAGLILIDPITDCRLRTSSLEEFTDNPFLTEKEVALYVKNYQREPKDILDPLFSPLVAKDNSRLPDTLIFAAERNPLFDDAKIFSEVLEESDVPVNFMVGKEKYHCFMNYPSTSGWFDRMMCISDFINGQKVTSIKLLTKKERFTSKKSRILLVQ